MSYRQQKTDKKGSILQKVLCLPDRQQELPSEENLGLFVSPSVLTHLSPVQVPNSRSQQWDHACVSWYLAL
jgi:hypothetical protein